MKTKKENKSKKHQLLRYNSPLMFLVFSIVLAVTIVACTKDFDETQEPAAPSFAGNTYGLKTSGEDAEELATFIFKEIGVGTLRTVGEQGMGWVLGAMGLAQQGGASSAEVAASLGEINTELTAINNNLDTIISHLDEIKNAISQLGCHQVISKLDNSIARIRHLIKIDFQPMVTTAMSGTAVPQNAMNQFVDAVLIGDGTATGPGIPGILDLFEQILWARSDGGIMTICLQPGYMPPPTAGFGTDTVYYNQIQHLTSYYYGYYVNALLLFNEAKYYKAWKSAYDNNLINSGYTNSNIKTICALTSVDTSAYWVEYYCNQTVAETQETYHSLKQIFTLGGAPYTNDYQILNYKSSSSHTLWARSIEKYNADLGFNCPDPFYWNYMPCGPLQGKYNHILTSTTYRELDGWEFADKDVLQTLFPGTVAGTFSTVGTYLESIGFESLVGTGKVVQAYQNEANHYGITLAGSGGTAAYQSGPVEIYVIPFFYTDMPAIANSSGLIITDNDFNSIFPRYKYGAKYLTRVSGYDYWTQDYRYHHIPALTICGEYTGNYAQCVWFNAFGKVSLMGAGYTEKAFHWTDENYATNNNNLPGWLKWKQKNQYMEALLWPVNFITNPTCGGRLGYGKTNNGGMVTMCGDDFTAWLNIVLPKPAIVN